MKRKLILVFIVPAIFFIISLLTLKDYGISWDEPIHFYRGHAYLHFFLTGNTNFSDLPKIRDHMPKREGFTLSEDPIYQDVNPTRRSYYQNEDLTYEYWMIHDAGHPVINDELAALSNYIFFQKLGITGDIESHHLFNILTSTLLVAIVSIFAYQISGTLAAIISSVTVATYPLFFAESKFNIKDPPEAAFFTLTIWSFWMSLKKGNWKWLLLSVISFSIAFGTKFNILFIPIIIIPYVFIRYLLEIKNGAKSVIIKLKKVSFAYWLILIISPAIILGIFFASWPYLWQDPVVNFLKIFGYYKDIGTGFEYQPGYYLWKFNLYPAFWILITTPPIVILLFFAGIFYSLKSKDKEKTPILWLIWFVVPILRVTIPGSSLYGGVRQIMEYIPALALVAGLGATFILNNIKSNFLKGVFFLTIVVSTLLPIIKYHPNQNVYFNFLIGGIRGAKERQIPYWGNSFGNAYWQAIQWLNENAPLGSRLAFIQATGLSLPRIMLRNDLEYWNNYWSGIKREGEYLLELTHNDPVKVYEYAWNYVDRILIPAYEVKVDGVAIAKIWKNDLEHTKEEYKKGESLYKGAVEITTEGDQIIADPKDIVNLSRFIVEYEEKPNCSEVKGSVSYSPDDTNWINMNEPVPFYQISTLESLSNGKMTYFFAGEKASKVRYVSAVKNSCIFNIKKISLFVFEK